VENFARDIRMVQLRVDPGGQKAVATIEIAESESPGASFDAGALLTIESVEIDDQQVSFAHDRKRARLDVDAPASTTPVSLVISYSFVRSRANEGVSSAGRTCTCPYYCGNVFPCHADPADGARYLVELSDDSDIASGESFVSADDTGTEAPAYMIGWAV